MKVAIMQPYIFPYIGYFQLIHAVDTFVFYDDVNFIKRGWINRNKLLINGKEGMFSMPLKSASQNDLIKDTQLAIDGIWLRTFYSTIEHNYSKAPHYSSVYGLIKTVLEREHRTIGELAMCSVEMISDYIGLKTKFEISSVDYHKNNVKRGIDRLLAICHEAKATVYINPIGGQSLYSKKEFKNADLQLYFIQPDEIRYKQFGNEFVPWLSILDVVMFNSVDEVKQLLKDYTLL